MLYPFDSEKPRGDEPINMYVNQWSSQIETRSLKIKSMVGQGCFCCGAKPAHSRSQCPAKDVTGHKYGKKGHYRKCCKSKTGKQDIIGELGRFTTTADRNQCQSDVSL